MSSRRDTLTREDALARGEVLVKELRAMLERAKARKKERTDMSLPWPDLTTEEWDKRLKEGPVPGPVPDPPDVEASTEEPVEVEGDEDDDPGMEPPSGDDDHLRPKHERKPKG